MAKPRKAPERKCTRGVMVYLTDAEYQWLAKRCRSVSQAVRTIVREKMDRDTPIKAEKPTKEPTSPPTTNHSSLATTVCSRCRRVNGGKPLPGRTACAET